MSGRAGTRRRPAKGVIGHCLEAADYDPLLALVLCVRMIRLGYVEPTRHGLRVVRD